MSPTVPVHNGLRDPSPLQQLLSDHLTMPATHGLLVPQRWRRYPSICDFSSELFYGRRLASRPELAKQEL
jgi:uncharacterized protein